MFELEDMVDVVIYLKYCVNNIMVEKFAEWASFPLPPSLSLST